MCERVDTHSALFLTHCFRKNSLIPTPIFPFSVQYPSREK